MAVAAAAAAAAAAFLISGLIAIDRRRTALIVAMILLAGATARFANYHLPVGYRDFSAHPSYRAAMLVELQTKPGTALIVFGIDWSSEIHYYAKRKGIALPLWANEGLATRLFDKPEEMMGGLITSAVVDRRAVHFSVSRSLDTAVSEFVNRCAQRSRLASGPEREALAWCTKGRLACEAE